MSLKKYTKDYEIVESMDKNGRMQRDVVYHGALFEVSLDKAGLRSFKQICWISFAVILGIHLGVGFIENQGLRQVYIVLPYVFVYVPLYFLATGALQLPIEKRSYRRKEIDLSFEQIKKASYALLALIGIELVGELLFLSFSSLPDRLELEFLHLLLEGLTMLPIIALIRKQKTIRIQTQPNPEAGGTKEQ